MVFALTDLHIGGHVILFERYHRRILIAVVVFVVRLNVGQFGWRHVVELDGAESQVCLGLFFWFLVFVPVANEGKHVFVALVNQAKRAIAL